MMFDFTSLNPDMLAQLAKDVDPAPFLKATEPGGAMDMGGSGQDPQAMLPGGAPASMVPGAPQAPGAGMLPPGFAQMLNPQAQQGMAAPGGVMPTQGRAINMPPPVQTPQINRVPSLAELLKSRGSM